MKYNKIFSPFRGGFIPLFFFELQIILNSPFFIYKHKSSKICNVFNLKAESEFSNYVIDCYLIDV